MRRVILAGAFVTAAAVAVAGQQPMPPTPPAASAPGAAQPGPDTPAATVNGEVIRLGDLDAYIKGKLPVGPLTAAQARQLRTEIVSDMIDDVLLRQFLRKNAPKVEAAEVDQHLKAL